MPAHLKSQYIKLKRIAVKDLGSTEVAQLICEMALHALKILDGCEFVELQSAVAGKTYFGFKGEVVSRPINVALYLHDPEEFGRLLEALLVGMEGTPEEITKVTYTIANAVFAAHDVNEVGRKASATFFEILIGHLVARAIGLPPRTKVTLPEAEGFLPTDFVFDPGRGRKKIHLTLKTSTRERAVQAWVHQLVLDRIFSDNVYLGIFVVCGETKRAAKTGRITEICVPLQWRMFQSRVAKLTRVYYLDPPEPYLALAPQIEVRSFGRAISELPELLS